MKRFLCHVGYQPGYFLDLLGNPLLSGIILDPDHISATKAKQIRDLISERLVDPLAYHLALPKNSHSNPVANLLKSYSVKRHNLDVSTARQNLQTIVTEAVTLERSRHCTALISPYFFAASVTDPWLELSLNSSLATMLITPQNEPVYCGLYISDSIVRDQSQRDNLLARMTQLDVAGFYLLVDRVIPGNRMIVDESSLKALVHFLNVLANNGYDTVLGHCSLEGIVLQACSGLCAYGSAKVFASRRRSIADLGAPAFGFRRNPQPHYLVKELLADVHHDEFWEMHNAGFNVGCGCVACQALLAPADPGIQSKLASQHYVLCLSTISNALESLPEPDRKPFVENLLQTALHNVALIRPQVSLDLRRFSHLWPWLAFVQS